MEKDGQTTGILYGFVNLADFSDSISTIAYDGNVQIYVADGETGDFLVDTWHDELGNIYDADIWDRKVKSGYDFHEMKMDFAEGKSGHIAFWSNTAGEYFYSCYMPVGIDRWMIQITVLESVAFAKTIQVRKVMILVAALEILTFAIYFIWILSQARNDANKKNQQLAQVFYMYDVQQTLFDAHKDPVMFNTALQKVSTMLTANTSFFLTLEGSEIKEVFFSSPSDMDQEKFPVAASIPQPFPTTLQCLGSGQSLLLYPEDISAMNNPQGREDLFRYHINNLMLAPVLNTNGELAGVLGSLNMKRRWTDSSLLECVSRSFMMAMNSRNFYCQVEQLSIIDAMTGLRNRNCYEHSLESYGEKPTDTLCCLYIDANGLHELNNSLGHAAGDAMLISIGTSLKTLFSPQDCYRIGGDEFLVFCTGYDKVQLSQRIDQLKERMTLSGYAISIGVAWLNESFDVKDMVSIAEKEMYEAKRLYYERSDNAPKARIINQKMEHIILERKDRDAFLDAISSRFMGVYVVNMQTDFARIIYKPSYFSEILDDNHSRFIPSMQSYISTYVAEDDRKAFLDFLNYNSIRNQFLSENVITFYYHKEDGNKLVLRIYPTRDYTPDNPESIWLFEKDAN